MTFWHSFNELADELTKHVSEIKADNESRSPLERRIINWYNANRLDPEAADGRAIEECWRWLEEWKATREKPMNELMNPDEKAKTTIAPMAAEALEFAKWVEIDGEKAYVFVAEWLTTQKAIRKELNATFDPTLASITVALNVQRAAKNRYTKALDEAETIAKGKMGAWVEMRERAKAERERKLRDEARKIAEAEKKAEVERLAKAGQAEAAEAVAAAPVTPLAVIDNTPAVPKVDGIAIRHDEYEWNIDEPEKLPREYLAPDPQKIGAVVRALGLEARIPGVSVKRKIGIAAGAR